MLVFISDLHLTDNSTFATIHPGAFEVFAGDLEWMVERACKRRGGARRGDHFEPLERVDLVMLGDIFDLLRTKQWQEDNPSQVMPWTPEMAPVDQQIRAHAELAARIDRIVAATIAHNRGGPEHTDTGIACLRTLSERGVEIRDEQGRAQRIPLKIWYMAGNHDWPLHVGLPVYDGVRQRIIDAFGLAHPDAGAFAHSHEDTPPELREVLERHKVFAAHGDIYDPNNFPVEQSEHHRTRAPVGLDARAHASLGDAIVIRVLNGLPAKILARIDPDDDITEDRAFVAALEELDNVRPMLAIPQWLASVLQRHESADPDPSMVRIERRRREAVRDALSEVLHRLLSEPFVRRHVKPWWPSTVEALQLGAIFNRAFSLERIARLSLRHQNRVHSRRYERHALGELNRMRTCLGERPFEFVVYGHTHEPEVVPLDLDYPRGWVYLNAGTWRRVHRRCVADGERIKFLDYHVMSMVAVYAGSERRGRPYETWTGTLGLRPDAPGR